MTRTFKLTAPAMLIAAAALFVGVSAAPAHADQVSFGTPPKLTATTAKNHSPVYALGDFDVSVGVMPVQSTLFNQFNDANYVVTVGIGNIRGTRAETENANLDMYLVDDAGVAHSPTVCSGCPIPFGDDGSLTLVPGGITDGAIYFKLPSGAKPVSVLWQPRLSGPSLTIPLPE